MVEQPPDNSSQGDAESLAEELKSAQEQPEEKPAKPAVIASEKALNKVYGRGVGKGEKNILEKLQRYVPDINIETLDETLESLFTKKPEDEQEKHTVEKLQKQLEQANDVMKQFKQTAQKQLQELKDKFYNGIVDRALVAAASKHSDYAEDAAEIFKKNFKVEVDEATMEPQVFTRDGKPVMHREGENAGESMNIEDAMKDWLYTKRRNFLRASEALKAGSGTKSSEAPETVPTISLQQIGKWTPKEVQANIEAIRKTLQAGKIS